MTNKLLFEIIKSKKKEFLQLFFQNTKMAKGNYLQRNSKEILKSVDYFCNYYSLLRRYAEKVIIKSSLQAEEELSVLGAKGDFTVFSMTNNKYREDVCVTCYHLFEESILEKTPKFRRPKKSIYCERGPAHRYRES